MVDWPGAHYWRELAAHFPDAKVLLASYVNIRDLLTFDKLVMPLTATS